MPVRVAGDSGSEICQCTVGAPVKKPHVSTTALSTHSSSAAQTKPVVRCGPVTFTFITGAVVSAAGPQSTASGSDVTGSPRWVVRAVTLTGPTLVPVYVT